MAGQVVVLSCNPTRIFPEPEVLWYIKNFVDSTLINVVPVHTIPCSQKYRTINDGHDLVINDITANDIYSLFFNGTKSGDIILASKVYACAAFYTRLNSNRGYYIFPRYKLKIVGEADCVHVFVHLCIILTNRFTTRRFLSVFHSKKQSYFVKRNITTTQFFLHRCG